MPQFEHQRLVTLTVPVLMLLAAVACGPSVGGAEKPAADDEHVDEEEDQEHLESDSGGMATAGVEIDDIEVPIEGHDHIGPSDKGEYENWPPSSGQHRDQTVNWGFYAEQIPPELYVHNLEHSGIVVAFDCEGGMGACPDLVEDLEEWQAGLPESKWGEAKALIFPFSGLDTQIVALAWGWQLNLDEFDADALTEFYVRHLDRGPEDVP